MNKLFRQFEKFPPNYNKFQHILLHPPLLYCMAMRILLRKKTKLQLAVPRLKSHRCNIQTILNGKFRIFTQRIYNIRLWTTGLCHLSRRGERQYPSLLDANYRGHSCENGSDASRSLFQRYNRATHTKLQRQREIYCVYANHNEHSRRTSGLGTEFWCIYAFQKPHNIQQPVT